MRPVRKALSIASFQAVAGQKEDRIPTTTEGLSTKHIIHDTVVQRRGEREYLRIKPYVRLVARLATSQPEDTQTIPGFRRFISPAISNTFNVIPSLAGRMPPSSSVIWIFVSWRELSVASPSSFSATGFGLE